MIGIVGGRLIVLTKTANGVKHRAFDLDALECQSAAHAVDAIRGGTECGKRRNTTRKIGSAESIDIWREVNRGVTFSEIQKSHGITPRQIEGAVGRCENGRYGKLEP